MASPFLQACIPCLVTACHAATCALEIPTCRLVHLCLSCIRDKYVKFLLCTPPPSPLIRLSSALLQGRALLSSDATAPAALTAPTAAISTADVHANLPVYVQVGFDMLFMHIQASY